MSAIFGSNDVSDSGDFAFDPGYIKFRNNSLHDGQFGALPPGPPSGPPPGGILTSPHNEPMESRVAKLEAAMEHVQRDLGEIKTDIREIKRDARGDFRLIFGALIAVALGLAGMMAKGFGWV